MKNLTVAATTVTTAMMLVFAVACTRTRTEPIEEMPAGTEVTVRTADGTLVQGKIAKVEPNIVTLTERPNSTTEISRESISEVKRVSPVERGNPAEHVGATKHAPPAEHVGATKHVTPAEHVGAATHATPAERGEVAERRAPAAERRRSEAIVRTFTIPDNTPMTVTLNTALASDTSRVEQRVNGTLASGVEVDGDTVIPAGSALSGFVTHAQESAKVKGRAELAFRFTTLTVGATTYDIDTKPLSYVAENTKKDDAVKIGVGAGVGSVIGAIAGGKKGAAIGAAVGAGAGTGVVLATDGKEVRLAEGRKLTVSLTNPLTIRTK